MIDKKMITIFTVAFFFLAIVMLSIRIVRAGTVKVVMRMGKVTDRTLRPGIHLIVPVVEGTTTYNTKLVTYETAIKKKQEGSRADYKDFPVDTNTSDGQPVDIAYTIRFSVDPKKAPWVAQNIGNEEDLVEKVVKTESRIWARNVPRRFEAEVLYTGKGSEKVQQDIEKELLSVFKNKGVILDRIGIREIYFEDDYVAAIRQKQIEAEKVKTAKNVALRAEEEKKAAITKAEGEAEAQRLQQQTLTEDLLSKLWIEKWNGSLPTYYGNAQPLLDIGQ